MLGRTAIEVAKRWSMIVAAIKRDGHYMSASGCEKKRRASPARAKS